MDHLLRYLLFVGLVEVHKGSFEFVKFVEGAVVLVEFELVILDAISGYVCSLLLFFFT